MAITEVCLSIPLHACILIRVAEHLGDRLLASPPPLPRPDDGGGQPWPCACAHGPKKTQQPSRHLSLNNDRHENHNRDIDHFVSALQLRHERAATVGSRLSPRRLHLWNLLTCTTKAKRQRAATVGYQLSFPRLHLWNLPDMHVNQRRPLLNQEEC